MSAWIWIVGAIVVGVAFVIPGIMRWRMGELSKMMRLRDQFFDAARKLVADDDVPMSVVDQLDMISRIMHSPRVGRFIVVGALSGRLRAFSLHPPKGTAEYMEDVHSMRPELQGLLGKASVTGLLAATYTNPILGPLIRRAILFSVGRNQEQAEIVVRSFPCNGPLPSNGAPA